MKPETQQVIDRLEAAPKYGERYEGGSEKARRNPIRSDTGQLLHSLILAKHPAKILELGTAYGLSGMYLASALELGGKMDTIEFDPQVAAEAQKNFDKAKLPVYVHAGDAFDVIHTLAHPVGRHNGRYSCVFLDADKKSYLAYLKLLMANDLLMPDCLILADNVIDRKSECQDFLDFMQDFPHTIISTECGLLVGRV